MAAFSSLISGELPPVGLPISLKANSSSDDFSVGGYSAIPLGSGTQALALAMLDIKNRQAAVVAPEVIIPAYGCPDLVAAAVYSGLIPVLVDTEKNSHCFDSSAIKNAIGSNTVAIVAVNFLGIPEKLSNIRRLIDDWPAVSLIEDNAQWYPELFSGKELVGDYVCLSFGRGKPVSLLGGGMLLVREPADVSSLNKYIDTAQRNPVGLLLKARIYNTLLTPFFYQFLSRNPFIKLGSTVYKPLSFINVIDECRMELLSENVNVYLARGREIEFSIRSIFSDSRKFNIFDLSENSGDESGRLLRYPVLCECREARDELYDAMSVQGLGPSKMYQTPLVEIDGVRKLVKCYGGFDEALNFSSCLLTVPVHDGMSSVRLEKLQALLS